MAKLIANPDVAKPGFGRDYGEVFKRFWGFLTKPSRTFEMLKSEDVTFSRQYFSLLCSVYAIITTVFFALSLKTNPTPLPLISFYSLIFLVLLLGTIISVYIYTALLHILVFIAGGREGRAQTTKAGFYALTPYLFIPVIGIFWSLWLQAKALVIFHNISAKKAWTCVITMFAIMLIVLISMSGSIKSVLESSGIYGSAEPGKVLTISVVKGPVQDSTINVYELLPNGEKGNLLLGPLKTDAFGNIDIPLLSELPYRLFIEAKGGTYTDEVSGMPVKMADIDMMTAVLPAGIRRVAVTPFTDMAAALAIERIRQGVPIDIAVTQSNIDVAQRYNIQSVLEVVPVMASSKEAQQLAELEERKYSALLGGLAKEAADLKARAIDLANALARDWSDGRLDGMQNNAPITLRDMLGKEITLPADAGRERLQEGISDFLKSSSDATKIKELYISVNPLTGSPDFAITTTALPNWESGRQGAFTLTARGGKTPYVWALKAGSAMPPGFGLSRDGIISGTYTLGQSTTKRITPPFTVTVADSAGQSREIELRITIIALPPVLNLVPVACVVNQLCQRQVATATGGFPEYYYKSDTFRIGAPPFGMLVTTAGLITGVPKNLGNFQFGVCVVDSVAASRCGTATLRVITQEDMDKELLEVSTGLTNPRTLSVKIEDDESLGMVTSEPYRLACPGICSEIFNDGVTVTLTALPNRGAVFTRWEGACTGTGSCVVLMNSDKQVTAVFRKEGEPERKCHLDDDCLNFAQSSCDGPNNARCSDDGLCHCCLSVCYGGTNCECIPCSAGCTGGTYCERDVCVFKLGGQPVVSEAPASSSREPPAPAPEEQIFGGKITSAECTITGRGSYVDPFGITVMKASDYKLTAIGTATSSLLQGGEGAGLMVAYIGGTHMQLSCGSWTQTADTRCVRKEGQPETTEWTATYTAEDSRYHSGRTFEIRLDILNASPNYPVTCPVGPEGPSV